MDNNKPVTPQSPQPAPQAAPQVTQPSPVQTPPTQGGGKKLMLWVAVGVIILVLVGGGAYLLLSKQQKSNQANNPKPSIEPVVTMPENLDQQLNSIDVQASGSADFNSVDQDLQNL